jgi:dihydropyrimidinase
MALFKTVTTPFTKQPTTTELQPPVLPEKPSFQGGRPTATLIQNGTIVTVEGSQRADLLVIGETIAALSKKFNIKGLPPNTRVLDATGCYVFPGGIDPHTHMEMPFMGTQSSDDFETGTRAALIGGTTTILDFAMQDAQHSLLETLAQWESKAQKAVCDYGFHMAVTQFDPTTSPLEMATLVKDRGITSFKVFMAYKQALMVGDDALLAILDEATKHRATVLAHCEHGDMIDYLVQKAKSQGHLTADYHAKTRPPLVEAEATGRFADLAYLTNANIYIVHLSCKLALDRVRQAMARGQHLNVETCIQYLLLSDALYEQETQFDAAKWVFSPPLRAYEDQVAHGRR